MSGLYADSPQQAYRQFRDYLNGLLNKTITSSRLLEIQAPRGIFLSFRQGGNPTYVKPGRGYFLYVGHALEAVGAKLEGETKYRLQP